MSKMGKIISAPAKLPNILATPRPPMQDQSKGQKAQGKTPESAVPLVGLHIGRQPVGFAVLAQM